MTFQMWTVYDHPLDYPDYYVARKWLCGKEPRPTDEILLDVDLNSLRKKLPSYLYRLDREPKDDPKIIEVWI